MMEDSLFANNLSTDALLVIPRRVLMRIHHPLICTFRYIHREVNVCCWHSVLWVMSALACIKITCSATCCAQSFHTWITYYLCYVIQFYFLTNVASGFWSHGQAYFETEIPDHLWFYVSLKVRMVGWQGAHADHYDIDTDYQDPEDYLNDEDQFNITNRLTVLFPLLDTNPFDGFVSLPELQKWHFLQGQKTMQHRTNRELENHDKNHDGQVSFKEYLPHMSDEELGAHYGFTLAFFFWLLILRIDILLFHFFFLRLNLMI